MSFRRDLPFEKFAAAAAAVVALASGLVHLRSHRPIAVPALPVGPGTPAVHVSAPPPDPRPEWRRPAVQSSGWEFEIFTPPAVYFDPEARAFTAGSPEAEAVRAGPAPVELVAVRRDLYRLQLVGFFGGNDAWLGAFARPGSSETWLAREGRRFDELGLTLRRLELRRVPIDGESGQPVNEAVGIAVLHDERAGGEVELATRAAKHTEALLAVLRVGLAAHEAREGEVIVAGTRRFRVDRIQADPPEVVLSGVSEQPAIGTIVLQPGASAGALAALPTPRPGGSAQAGRP